MTDFLSLLICARIMCRQNRKKSKMLFERMHLNEVPSVVKVQLMREAAGLMLQYQWLTFLQIWNTASMYHLSLQIVCGQIYTLPPLLYSIRTKYHSTISSFRLLLIFLLVHTINFMLKHPRFQLGTINLSFVLMEKKFLLAMIT